MKKRKPDIYTVVTFWIEEDDKKSHHRTPAFFLDKEKAVKCINENWGDIYECGYYNYALIEPFTEGLYGSCARDLEWYFVEYNPDFRTNGEPEYTVSRCSTPKRYKNIVGFGLG